MRVHGDSHASLGTSSHYALIEGPFHGPLQLKVNGQYEVVAGLRRFRLAYCPDLPSSHIYLDVFAPLVAAQFVLEGQFHAGQPYPIAIGIITAMGVFLRALFRDAAYVTDNVRGQVTADILADGLDLNVDAGQVQVLLFDDKGDLTLDVGGDAHGQKRNAPSLVNHLFDAWPQRELWRSSQGHRHPTAGALSRPADGNV